MTIKQALTLRNFMIILCIFMSILLGKKFFLVADKINAVQEGDRLYAANDLIAAEAQYRQAAGNPSILYMEDRIAKRLEKLSPITDIRSSLSTLVLSARAQAATKDFAGLMNSYNALLTLKSTYMKPGGPYEAYYRQLSAASGISGEMSAYFQQFKKQFLAELEQSTPEAEGSGDNFKWNLLLIPDIYYGDAASKQELLASQFHNHDTAKLKSLAAAGKFSSLLNQALSMVKAYENHDYDAPWVMDQTEASGTIILGKDLDGESISAFAEHAAAYRKFAGGAGFSSSKVLALIDKHTARLLKSAGRKVRAGQYAEAIQLYGELGSLEDTSADIASARLAWNIAEPVRLLPGGEEQGRYSNVISATGRFGTKVMVAGTDSNGRLYYAAMSNDDSVVSLTGDVVSGFERLHSLTFDDSLGVSSGLPVVLVKTGSEDSRTTFTAYEMKPQGMSVLFTFTADDYKVQPDDTMVVYNTDTSDNITGINALYRKIDGVYQYAEIIQEYTLIPASELELHPYEKVMLHCDIYQDNSGRYAAYADERYIALQGNISVTGSSVVSGQFQYSYETVGTDTGEQYVPVFVVDSIGSLSSE